MSEYQYYEFRAVDRPLTESQMREIRRLSTRAAITPSSFVNVYNYGDFKGDPAELMERYYDAHIYVANWGTHQLMLRLPRRLLDPEIVSRYAVEGCLEVDTADDSVILDFMSEDDGGDWVDDEEAEHWMPSLLPLRDELARGDLRALYLGWLAAASIGWGTEDPEDEQIDRPEPPVPPGLSSLSPALVTLVEFLRIDEDLLAIAAEASEALPEPPAELDLPALIRELSVEEKDALLLRLLQGASAVVHAELLRRLPGSAIPQSAPDVAPRTAGHLLVLAQERTRERHRLEAERRAAERARQAQEEAAARGRYLDSLAGQEEQLWQQAQALIDTTQPKAYDQAVAILRDLHDLSVRDMQAATFAARLDSLKVLNARRPSFIQRLDAARL